MTSFQTTHHTLVNKIIVTTPVIAATVLLCILFSSLSSLVVDAQSTIINTYTGGTVDPNLRAFSSFNLTSVALPTAANSFFHINLFDQLTHASFNSIPIAAVPVCIGVNITGGYPIEFTAQKLANWMSDSVFNESINSPRSTVAVGTDQLALVLAANSPTTRVIIRSLNGRGIGDFAANSSVLPASVTGNVKITFVADDDAVVQTIKTTANTVGFVPVTRGAAVPCASVRVLDDNTLESLTSYARLTETSSVDFSVDIEGNSVVATGALYPFIGPALLSIPVSSTCVRDQADSAMFFVRKLFADSTFFGPIAQWGVAPLQTVDRLTAVSRLVSALPCSSTRRINSGGSSAIEVIASTWILRYLVDNNIFVDYAPDGSGSGLRGIKANTHRIAGSDALFSDTERAEFPNVKFFPAVSFGISVIFNLPGISSLVIPRCLFVPIFRGEITRWNDPRLVEANVQIALPDAPINIIARTTSSGTTEVFTTGLRELDVYCSATGQSTVQVTKTWNLNYAVGTSGTSSMLAALRSTPFSIGYVSASSARALGISEAQVRDEKTLALSSATPELISVALESTTIDRATGAVSFQGTIAKDSSAYPFPGITYFLVSSPQPAGNCSEVKDALDFVRWTQESTVARQMAIDNDFVPLPEAMNSFAKSVVIDASCGGQLLYPPPVEKNMLPIILGAAIPSSLALIIGLLAFQYWYARKDLRSTTHAIKKTGEKMCAVFTDIESSSTIWSSDPLVAGLSLDLHNKIIRELIEKNCGYEVKTIGDAFFVVFKKPSDTLQFALDVQLSLFNAPWTKKQELEEIYGEWILSDKSPYFDQDPELSRVRADPSLFAGLSVRIGVHFGSATVNELDGGNAFDYIGATSNEASRIESCGHGGQITISSQFLSALREEQRSSTAIAEQFGNQHCNMTDLGKQTLRGIHEPLEIIQVLPSELSKRKFPPLRVDLEDSAFADALGGMDEEQNPDKELVNGNTATDSATVMSAFTANSTTSSNGKERIMRLEASFARFLSQRSKDKITTAAEILDFYDRLKLLLSIKQDKKQKTDMITDLMKEWRMDKIKSSAHDKYKKVLGDDNYNMMRIAMKMQLLKTSSRASRASQDKNMLSDTSVGNSSGSRSNSYMASSDNVYIMGASINRRPSEFTDGNNSIEVTSVHSSSNNYPTSPTIIVSKRASKALSTSSAGSDVPDEQANLVLGVKSSSGSGSVMNMINHPFIPTNNSNGYNNTNNNNNDEEYTNEINNKPNAVVDRDAENNDGGDIFTSVVPIPRQGAGRDTLQPSDVAENDENGSKNNNVPVSLPNNAYSHVE